MPETKRGAVQEFENGRLWWIDTDISDNHTVPLIVAEIDTDHIFFPDHSKPDERGFAVILLENEWLAEELGLALGDEKGIDLEEYEESRSARAVDGVSFVADGEPVELLYNDFAVLVVDEEPTGELGDMERLVPLIEGIVRDILPSEIHRVFREWMENDGNTR